MLTLDEQIWMDQDTCKKTLLNYSISNSILFVVMHLYNCFDVFRILKSAPTVSWPNCLALDYVANRVYWVDAQKDHIVSMGFDGKNYKIVLEKTGSVKHPFGIAVHKKLMFWTDWTLQHLHMADKDRGKGVSEIVQAKNAMDVKAFSSIHRQGTNACSK